MEGVKKENETIRPFVASIRPFVYSSITTIQQHHLFRQWFLVAMIAWEALDIMFHVLTMVQNQISQNMKERLIITVSAIKTVASVNSPHPKEVVED